MAVEGADGGARRAVGEPGAVDRETESVPGLIVADGRVINGVISEKNDRTLTVATPTDRIVLATDEIEEIRPSNLSIMPEGPEKQIGKQQMADLIEYLMNVK